MEKLNISDSVYFVTSKKNITNSLFTGKTTAAGTFKKLAGRIHFYDMQGNLFAALIDNKHNEQFFVNASVVNGKTYYQYSTGELQEQKLGIAGLGYIAQRNIAKAIVNQLKTA